ncbi:putative Fido domain-containing protein [Seiridium cardinale]|uniref:Fido domain-containing protein n=1 Tax=Seiridium cardinale TaxID=138064 RepID=A0ABR2XWJ5_9PEZI
MESPSTLQDVSDPEKLFGNASQWLIDIRSSTNKVGKAEIEKQLWESIVRSIFGSNQIEGVGLGLNDTLKICRRILSGEDVERIDEQTPDYVRMFMEMHDSNAGSDFTIMPLEAFIRGRTEVVGHGKAFQYILDSVVSLDIPISEDLIIMTHRILCQNTPIAHHDGRTSQPERYASIYRDVHNIHVGAGSTMLTVPKMVPSAMKKMVANLSTDLETARANKLIDPFSLAAKYSLEFVQIHPFQDGNGRVCRMLLNAILCKYAGVVVPIGETMLEQEEYISIKKRASAEEHGHGEWALFVLNKAETRLRSMKKKMCSGKRLVHGRLGIASGPLQGVSIYFLVATPRHRFVPLASPQWSPVTVPASSPVT